MDVEKMKKLNGDIASIESDIEICVIRQSGTGFHSPGMVRKSLGADAVVAHTSKASRRAKSTEPVPLKPDDPFVKYSQEETATHIDNFPLEKRLSTMMKEQEHMSKSEVINCYRLLMSEKLRLERFLSIITKNNEMARNRLESDLLDAMMCIEDLKQALEVRMARRRRVDPHEAEERRYLIRQNKKLLSQLYESAKKIEHLEVTKVEMKEQLELLDFQIVEVENQKAILEEELRKLPLADHQETQTEETSDYPSAAQLMAELADYQMEQTALLARQHQLDAVIRQLRRENVELRDQLTKVEDAENSLTESDKPWAAGMQRQLEAQNERVLELECKLQAARNYCSQLEAKLSRSQGEPLEMLQAQSAAENGQVSQVEHPRAQETNRQTCDTTASTIATDDKAGDSQATGKSDNDSNNAGQQKTDQPSDSEGVGTACAEQANSTFPIVSQLVWYTFRPATCLAPLNGMGALDLQAVMQANQETGESGSAFRKPHVDDLLLQETIRTFHGLLAERDHDIAQLKHQLRFLQEENPNTIAIPELPALVESDVQTEDDPSAPVDGRHVTEEQYALLSDEVDALDEVLVRHGQSDHKRPEVSSFDRLLATVTAARDAIKSTITGHDQASGVVTLTNGIVNGNDGASDETEQSVQSNRLHSLQHEVERLTAEVQRLQTSCPPSAAKPETATLKGTNPSSESLPGPAGNCQSDQSAPHRGEHFSRELQNLRETSEMELAQSRLQLTERRIDDLEKQIAQLTEEISRAKADAHSAETSLVAARRTEVALRRRLIAAMDAPGNHRRGGNSGELAPSVRHSTSAMLSAAAGDFRDTVEMQATLLSLESRNTALLEAAQLDRSRLHEQAVRIGQLEAEHRALMARLGHLQTGEAAAQRGIVRLQALYEDMLREYSESRSQELNWKPRSRSRSALKHTNEHGQVATGGRPSSAIAKYPNGSGRPGHQACAESHNGERVVEGDSY